MVIAMFLAHLVGDFILQWDRLARWKSKELSGVLVHGLVVLTVTWLFSLPFDAGWWRWVLFIGLTHTAIDAAQLLLLKPAKSGIVTLGRFFFDQGLHLTIIVAALAISGYLPMGNPIAELLVALEGNRMLAYLLAYAFISMPTWILVEFIVYGLINDSAPDFSKTTNKYVGIMERWLITTFVILGQFILVPLVALPRLFFEGPRVKDESHSTIYVAELLASIAVAVVIGLGLRQL